MKLKKVLPITAMLLIALVSGCNKDVGTSSDLMSSSNLKAGPVPVNLGQAASFAILSKTGISTTGTTAITGDIGVKPISYAAITGFTLTPTTPSGTNTYATSPLVTGKVYAFDYTVPTPSMLTTAVSNMETAYTDAAGRPAGVGSKLNIGAGTVTGVTLAPGTYTWTGDVNITGDITLNGSSTSVWIFQIAGTLDLASGKIIHLTGGALAQNVFWQVAGAVTLFPGSHFEGTILAQTSVAMQDGATLNGRILAQTAVTLIANTIIIPAFKPAKGQNPIKFGPIRVTAANDIGSCNNVWAIDAFEKVYTITANGYGTYNVNVKYNHGTFVTIAGTSPGACESGTNVGTQVDGGIKGTMVQEYNGTVTGTLIPGAKCTSGTCVDTDSILATFFSSYSWTILPDGGHWTWKAVYKAGKHGTYTDTSENWPHNTGDIN